MTASLYAGFRDRSMFAPRAYRLLPFRFTRLDDARYVVTNDVGEHLVVRRDELAALVRHELPVTVPLYRELAARHFVFDDDSRVALDLLALKVRTRAAPIAELTGLHIFVVTLRCDHACHYCQVSRVTEDLTRFDMKREHADRALALVFRSPSPAIKIELQGGEPLLNFPLIQYIVEHATALNQQHGKLLQFVIASNLTRLDDEILAFCKQHRVYFSTSLDGPEDLHDAHRPLPGRSSYRAACEGIARIRSELGREFVSALMTTLGRTRLGEDFHYLAAGDVVRVEPQRGAIRALYRRNSRSNSFLVTERCDNYCVMCSQPPKPMSTRSARISARRGRAAAGGAAGVPSGRPRQSVHLGRPAAADRHQRRVSRAHHVHPDQGAAARRSPQPAARDARGGRPHPAHVPGGSALPAPQQRVGPGHVHPPDDRALDEPMALLLRAMARHRRMAGRRPRSRKRDSRRRPPLSHPMPTPQPKPKTPAPAVKARRATSAPQITDATILEVYVAAAGRCAFYGCNKTVMRELLTNRTARLGNIAHIVADKADGPRGDDPLPMEGAVQGAQPHADVHAAPQFHRQEGERP